jgi:hypothetical protein
VNFSRCWTYLEGAAISTEWQESLLRFVSVEKTLGNPYSAVDFDDETDGGQQATVIENCRFLGNQVSLGTVYSSGGWIKCINCYFKDNTHDLDTTQFLSDSWIIVEKCKFDKTIPSEAWLTIISCVTQFQGDPLGLCVPAIGACVQVQICTTPGFVPTGRFSATEFLGVTGKLVKTPLILASSSFSSASSTLSLSVVYLRSHLKESTAFEFSTDPRFSFPFASSISSHDSEQIQESSLLSAHALLSFPFVSSVSSHESPRVQESSLLSTHTRFSFPVDRSLMDLSSILAESAEYERITDHVLSMTFASSISSLNNEVTEYSASLSSETQPSLPSANSISSNSKDGSECVSYLSPETSSSIPFTGSIIYSSSILPESQRIELSIEAPLSLPFASSVSSDDTQHIGESSLISTETPLSLLFARSVVCSSSILHESGAFECFTKMPVSLSFRSSVSSHYTQHIGESFLVSTETPLSLPFTRSVVYSSSIQHESGAFEFSTEMPASFPSPASVVSLSSPLQKSRMYEPFTQTRLSLPFASSVSSHETQGIGDSSVLFSGLLLPFSSHSTLVSLRLSGTLGARGTRAFEGFGVSNALHISGFVGSSGTFGRSSHLGLSESISDSEVLTGTDSVKVDVSLGASLPARLRAPTSLEDRTLFFGNSGFVGDSLVFDESIDSEFPRSVCFLGISSRLSDARLSGLESTVTFNARSVIPPSSSLSRERWELSVAVIPSSADMADGASASNSSSVGIVAGSVLGAIILCSAVGSLLFLVLRSQRKESPVASTEMDGDPYASGTDTWTEKLDIVFENQLDADDGYDDPIETIPRLE